MLVALITGCSYNVKQYPYISVSAGQNLGEAGSESYDPRCNVPASFELGIEQRNGLSYGVRHESNFDCGFLSPHPDRPEFYRDQMFIRYKFGGI